jgi:predicted RNA-binding protein with PIN domain
MKKLILDGYNVIHHLPKLSKHLEPDFEFARTVLVNFMIVWKGEHRYNGRITIVFDGNGPSNKSEIIDNIECIYSKSGQSADDCIISMIKNTHNTKEIMVVSNDNKIRNACISLGAVAETPIFLLKSPKTYCRKLKNMKSSNEISSAQKNEINSFLMEKWNIK